VDARGTGPDDVGQRHVGAFTVPTFTRDQIATLRELASGVPDKVSAHRLCLSRRGVTSRITRMMRLARVSSRVALVTWALQTGVLYLYAPHVQHNYEVKQ